MQPIITIEHGSPRVAGTRITVYDIFYLLNANVSVEEVADDLSITVEQVKAGLDYIAAQRSEIEEVHRRIEERNSRGNTAETREKLKLSQARMSAWQAANAKQRNGAHAQRNGL